MLTAVNGQMVELPRVFGRLPVCNVRHSSVNTVIILQNKVPIYMYDNTWLDIIINRMGIALPQPLPVFNICVGGQLNLGFPDIHHLYRPVYTDNQ